MNILQYKPLGITVTLMGVIPPERLHFGFRDSPAGYSEDFALGKETEKHAADYRCRVSDKLRADGLDSIREYMLRGNPAKAIVNLAMATPDNLVAMTIHGRSGLATLVLGSVAAKMLCAWAAPLFLVRPYKLHGGKG